MTTSRVAIKAFITWLMIQMLYTANTGIFFLGNLLCALIGSDTGICQPSIDLFVFLGVGMVSKYIEVLDDPKDQTLDMNILCLAALYWVLGDNLRVVLLGAWLPYYYMDTDHGKFWAYIGLAVITLMFPHLRRACRVLWPLVAPMLYNSIKKGCLKLCEYAIKTIRSAWTFYHSSSSPPLPALSVSAIITTAYIEPSAHIEPPKKSETTTTERSTQTDSPAMTDDSAQWEEYLPIQPFRSPKIVTKCLTTGNGIFSAPPDFDLPPMKRLEPSRIRKQRLRDLARRGSPTKATAPIYCPPSPPIKSVMFTPIYDPAPAAPVPELPVSPPLVAIESTPISPQPSVPASSPALAPVTLTEEIPATPVLVPALELPELMSEVESVPTLVSSPASVPVYPVPTVESATISIQVLPTIAAQPSSSSQTVSSLVDPSPVPLNSTSSVSDMSPPSPALTVLFMPMSPPLSSPASSQASAAPLLDLSLPPVPAGASMSFTQALGPTLSLPSPVASPAVAVPPAPVPEVESQPVNEPEPTPLVAAHLALDLSMINNSTLITACTTQTDKMEVDAEESIRYPAAMEISDGDESNQSGSIGGEGFSVAEAMDLHIIEGLDLNHHPAEPCLNYRQPYSHNPGQDTMMEDGVIQEGGPQVILNSGPDRANTGGDTYNFTITERDMVYHDENASGVPPEQNIEMLLEAIMDDMPSIEIPSETTRTDIFSMEISPEATMSDIPSETTRTDIFSMEIFPEATMSDIPSADDIPSMAIFPEAMIDDIPHIEEYPTVPEFNPGMDGWMQDTAPVPVSVAPIVASDVEIALPDAEQFNDGVVVDEIPAFTLGGAEFVIGDADEEWITQFIFDFTSTRDGGLSGAGDDKENQLGVAPPPAGSTIVDPNSLIEDIFGSDNPSDVLSPMPSTPDPDELALAASPAVLPTFSPAATPAPADVSNTIETEHRFGSDVEGSSSGPGMVGPSISAAVSTAVPALPAVPSEFSFAVPALGDTAVASLATSLVLTTPATPSRSVLVPVSISHSLPARPRPTKPPITLNMAASPNAPKLDRRFIVTGAPSHPTCNILALQPGYRPARKLHEAPRVKEAYVEEFEDNDGYRQKVLWGLRGAPPLDECALDQLERRMNEAAEEASKDWPSRQPGIDEQTALDLVAKRERDKKRLEAKKKAQLAAYQRRQQEKKEKGPSIFFKKKKRPETVGPVGPSSPHRAKPTSLA